MAARSARNGRSRLSHTVAVPSTAMAATTTHIAMSATSTVPCAWVRLLVTDCCTAAIWACKAAPAELMAST